MTILFTNKIYNYRYEFVKKRILRVEDGQYVLLTLLYLIAIYLLLRIRWKEKDKKFMASFSWIEKQMGWEKQGDWKKLDKAKSRDFGYSFTVNYSRLRKEFKKIGLFDFIILSKGKMFLHPDIEVLDLRV